MATGVKRIWLVRQKYVRPTLLEEYGLTSFCKTEPIPVYPLYVWKPENGLSHYGYLLEDLYIDDLEALKEVVNHHGKSSILTVNLIKDETTGKMREQTVEEALKEVSLQVNHLYGASGNSAKSKIKIPSSAPPPNPPKPKTPVVG